MTQISLVEKAFLLKKTPLFEELELDLLLTIAERLSTASFEKDDRIFELGQNAHRMYLIVDGCVDIRDEGGNTLAMVYAVDFFGDESIFNEKPRGYSAISATNTHLLTLSRSDIQAIISECPSVGIALLHAYSSTVSFREREKLAP